MPETSIANISQEYIDHLSGQMTDAKRKLDDDTKAYDVAYSRYTDANGWQKKAEAYWLKVEATEKLSITVFEAIENLSEQAERVNSNIDCTLDAVKLLVCNVHEVSRVLQHMTHEYQELKNAIDAKSMLDVTFKQGGAIMVKFGVLGEKLALANQAVITAINKVLDLIKAFYVLDMAMDSEKRVHHHHHHHGDDHHHHREGIKCGERMLSERGLEWQLAKLKRLLEQGMPATTSDDDDDPWQDTDTAVPTFPLPKGDDRYYDLTKSESDAAKGETAKAHEAMKKMDQKRRLSESSYKAYKAAYDAAAAAKNKR